MGSEAQHTKVKFRKRRCSGKFTERNEPRWNSRCQWENKRFTRRMLSMGRSSLRLGFPHYCGGKARYEASAQQRSMGCAHWTVIKFKTNHKSICQNNHIALASFAKWKHKLSNKVAVVSNDDGFTPVKLTDTIDQSSPINPPTTLTLTLGASITVTIQSSELTTWTLRVGDLRRYPCIDTL